MTDEQIANVLITDEQVESLLQELYLIKDKDPRNNFITVTPALHESINQFLFKDNPYKVRIEELG